MDRGCPLLRTNGHSVMCTLVYIIARSISRGFLRIRVAAFVGVNQWVAPVAVGGYRGRAAAGGVELNGSAVNLLRLRRPGRAKTSNLVHPRGQVGVLAYMGPPRYELFVAI